MLVGIWQTADGHVFDYFTPRAGAKSARTCQRQLAIRPAMPIGMQMASRKPWPGTIETIIQQIPAVTARPTYTAARTAIAQLPPVWNRAWLSLLPTTV